MVPARAGRTSSTSAPRCSVALSPCHRAVPWRMRNRRSGHASRRARVPVERQVADPDLVLGIEDRQPVGDVVDVLVVGAGDGRMNAEADDVEAARPRRTGERAEVVAGGAVALHRRGELDEDPARPAVERLDVGDRADGEDRAGVRGRLQRRGEDDGSEPAGQTGELVDGADGDGVGELGGDLGEHRPAEAVAVALDDGHESRAAASDPVDLRPPRGGVDGEPQGHGRGPYPRPRLRRGRAPGPGLELGDQRRRVALGDHALPHAGAVGEVVDETGDASVEQRRERGERGDPAAPVATPARRRRAAATRPGGPRRRACARRTGGRDRRGAAIRPGGRRGAWARARRWSPRRGRARRAAGRRRGAPTPRRSNRSRGPGRARRDGGGPAARPTSRSRRVG